MCFMPFLHLVKKVCMNQNNVLNKLIAAVTGLLMCTLTACGNDIDQTVTETETSLIETSNRFVLETEMVLLTPEATTPMEDPEIKEAYEMQLSINGKIFSVTLEDNDTVQALYNLLPLTLEMSELNGNEKYFYLDTSLTCTPERVRNIYAGDIMLYGDSCIVLFYDSFSTPYSYTRIGHIEDASELLDALGDNSATVIFSIVQ